MNEEDIKSLAHVYALVADMNAVMIESCCMVADNTVKQSSGQGILFGSDDFIGQVAQLKAIAGELTRISDGEIRCNTKS